MSPALDTDASSCSATASVRSQSLRAMKWRSNGAREGADGAAVPKSRCRLMCGAKVRGDTDHVSEAGQGVRCWARAVRSEFLTDCEYTLHQVGWEVRENE